MAAGRADPLNRLRTADVGTELDLATPPVSRRGDLWRLGPHRLLCGDARVPADYRRLLDGRPAQMVFTDPPYNVPIQGHVCGSGSVRHGEFVMASGEMSDAEFTGFPTAVLRNLADHAAEGSIHFVCMDWRHIGALWAAGQADRYVGHLLPLAFLAPDIVEAIAAGHQPPGLTAESLIKRTDLPLEWDRQREALGFT